MYWDYFNSKLKNYIKNSWNLINTLKEENNKLKEEIKQSNDNNNNINLEKINNDNNEIPNLKTLNLIPIPILVKYEMELQNNLKTQNENI